jgi:hypothetical protein
MSVVYVYPKCPAGNSEGHWLSALHRFASVFSKPSILTLELTFGPPPGRLKKQASEEVSGPTARRVRSTKKKTQILLIKK